MPSYFPNNAKQQLALGAINWEADTIKILLVGPTFDGNEDQDFVGDIVTLAELSGTGYVAGHGNSGRKTLTINTGDVEEDDAGNKAVIKATNPIWTAINAGTAHGAVIHKAGTTDDTDALIICFIEMAADIVTNGSDFTFEFASPGGGEGTVYEITN